MRDELKLTKEVMPQPKLQGLWRALDENANGFICAGEFGHFIKIALDTNTSGNPHAEGVCACTRA